MMKRILISATLLLVMSIECPLLCFGHGNLMKSLPNAIVSSPIMTSAESQLDFYLSGRLGLGISSFAWKGGPVNGTCSLSMEVATQMYSTGRTFLPGWYCSEASVGICRKGASALDMGYFGIQVLPFGYYRRFSDGDCRAVGKFGIYTGFPFAPLKYAGASKVDFGISVAADFEYRMLSLGLCFERGVLNIATPKVGLQNWNLLVKVTFKILSFK